MTEARIFLDGAVTLHPGDCLDVVKRLPDASVDAVVTDPPYALVSIAKRFGKPGAAAPKGAAYERAAAGFMGKGWDTGRVAFSVAFWKEVLRVLKPGGFCLAFGGPRTVHRLATALEDAGFDIRDRIVDLICADAPVVGFLESLATEQRAAFVRILEESTFAPELLWIFGSGMVKAGYLAPKAREVGPLAGLGKALKTAHEIVVVGRKPFPGTLVDTVLQHGVGAFNVDGCRVPAADGGSRVSATRSVPGVGDVYGDGWKPAGQRVEYRTPPEGRWPADVVHDGSDAVEAAFAQYGERGSSGGSRGAGGRNGAYSPIGAQPHVKPGFGDFGSPARFYYSPKADTDSRLGSNHPTVKPVDLVRYLVRLVTPEDGLVLDPFAGTGTTGEAAFLEGRRAVLVELEASYQADIARRLAHVAAGPQARFVAAAQARAARGAIRPRDEDAPPDLFDALGDAG